MHDDTLLKKKNCVPNMEHCGLGLSEHHFCVQSMGYCGLDMNTYFDKGHTEVRPGLFTLRFEETESHRRECNLIFKCTVQTQKQSRT